MSAEPVQIRDALVSEAPLILDIWRRAFMEDDTHGGSEDVERLIHTGHNSRLLLAVVEGQTVGTLIVSFDGWRGNMYRLAVLPEFQRRGIASVLVTTAERWLLESGCRRVRATVVREHEWATRFWRASGYTDDSSSYVRMLA